MIADRARAKGLGGCLGIVVGLCIELAVVGLLVACVAVWWAL